MSRRIGFIGLGIMGLPMAKNLLKAGHELVVYDLSAKRVDELVSAGAAKGESLGDVAARSGLIITMLPDGPDVEKAVLSPGGLLEAAKPGSTLIDMSSINPLISQKVGRACAAKGVHFLDAPVSGGEPKAVEGTLAIMVGGSYDTFANVKPVLDCLGASVTLAGEVGAGNVTKLANQIIVGCNIAAMGEALVLATKAGLCPETVFNAIRGGLAGSTVLEAKAPMVYSRDFRPGFRIGLHNKDLRNTLEAAEALDVPLPMTSLVQGMLVKLVNDGKGDLDHSGIVQFTEEAADTEVRRKIDQPKEEAA